MTGLTPEEQSLFSDVTIHSVIAWRSDSIMLARLRPVFMDLFSLDLEQHCHAAVDERTCRDMLPNDAEVWCTPCRIHTIVDRIQAVAKPSSTGFRP